MLTFIFSFLKLRHDVAVQTPVPAAAMQQGSEMALITSVVGVSDDACDEDVFDVFERRMVFADSLFDGPCL